MNTKILSFIGVLVAALAAILLVSMLNAPKTTVEVQGSDPVSADEAAFVPGSDAATVGGEDAGVKTSVDVADTDVITQVKVQE